jgi:nucleotide-binding universal stress UspA family protein
LKRLSRVLCAVAIDDRDRSVFEHALALARRHDAKMLLLNAVSPQVSFNRGATERVEFLRRLRSLAEAAGVDIRVTVQRGPVDEIILLHARARQVDLIVLGTARNHESRRGLSGWIAERVSRDAPCPTLVLPRASESPKALADGILCAVDFSPASQVAVQEAVRMSQDGTRLVTLMHVVNWPDHRGLGTDALNKLRDLIPPPERGAVMARVAVGRPVAEILQAAETMQAGLLVIGAARRTRIGSRLFGKTGQLLRDATCPVLAVPVPAPTRADQSDVTRLAA